ncbi:transcriptional regulator [Azospirillum argentinense]|uniref:transcriptional regulator n=1 Tax=Azospirillum argentinense TaxID=2970906 RepID=UPI003D815103
MKDHALSQAIAAVGGPAELGRRLQISSQAISQWRKCPPERVIQVEEATGGKVSRHALRPDLYPLTRPRRKPAPAQPNQGAA